MKHILVGVVCSLLFACLGIVDSYGQTVSAGEVDSTFKPSGTFWGQFFGDISVKVHADSLGQSNAANGRGNSEYSTYQKAFANEQIRRVYLGYTYNISKNFTTQWLAAYEEGTGVGGGNLTLDFGNERSFYMKLANIQWKNIFPNATLIFGAQATPAFVPSSETQWGYRSIEKTITDKYGIIKSADLGLGLSGSFDDAHNFGYDILYADGSGQKLETDRYKKVYADLWSYFMEKKIYVQLYGDINRVAGEVPSKDATILKLYVAYTTVPLTVGFEGFMYNTTNGIVDTVVATKTPETHDIKTIGLSFFATAQIIPNSLNAFARYDMFNPTGGLPFTGVIYANASTPLGFIGSGAALSTKENFFVVGLDYTPYKNVHIMPNVWYNSYSSQPVGNYSKLVGSTALNSDFELVPRLTVFYKF
ncbi:MAG: hypothetical protein Q8916_01740 [Bacteroidota bacterium]|nr:hypothetical protein [Bacteroidota bacterium]MDP4229109.1 hypothetical protein [Bacteroidota bacterium]MDP4237505.1 hypothetical protein [Bacteroidota bacterium]